MSRLRDESHPSKMAGFHRGAGSHPEEHYLFWSNAYNTDKARERVVNRCIKCNPSHDVICVSAAFDYSGNLVEGMVSIWHGPYKEGEKENPGV